MNLSDTCTRLISATAGLKVAFTKFHKGVFSPNHISVKILYQMFLILHVGQPQTFTHALIFCHRWCLWKYHGDRISGLDITVKLFCFKFGEKFGIPLWNQLLEFWLTDGWHAFFMSLLIEAIDGKWLFALVGNWKCFRQGVNFCRMKTDFELFDFFRLIVPWGHGAFD